MYILKSRFNWLNIIKLALEVILPNYSMKTTSHCYKITYAHYVTIEPILATSRDYPCSALNTRKHEIT